jgi:hypothetical protein
MYRLPGEIAIGSIKDKSSFENILLLDGMCNVNDLSLRINAQNDAFHDGDVGITEAKVSGQGYYRSHPLFSGDGFAEIGDRYGKNDENDAENDSELE